MAGPGEVWLNEKAYRLVESDRQRAFTTAKRPSQSTDPAQTLEAEWQLHGPIGNSREPIVGGPLGHDWSDDLDTRFDQLLLPATYRTSVDQTTKDPIGATVSAALGGFALGAAPLGGGTSTYSAANVTHIDEQAGRIFTHRGGFSTLNWITGSAPDEGSPTVTQTTTHSATVKDVGTWKGKGRLAFGPAAPVKTRSRTTNSNATYDEETSVSIGGAGGATLYARAVNAGNDRAWLARSDGTGASENQAFYVLDDFDTFSNSFPVGSGFHNVNGIGSLGPFTVFGMEDGLYGFTDFGKPVKILDMSESVSSQNGHSFIEFWGWLYFRTVDGLKAWNGGRLVSNVGLETMKNYEGSINGRVTALGKIKDFLVAAYRTEDDTQTYIVLGLPNEQTGATGKLDWYPFATIIAGRNVEVIHGSGTSGLPMIYWGEATRLAFARFRRGSRDIDSSNYRYDAGGGTWYGTTMMRRPQMRKNLRYCQYVSENHSGARTSYIEWQVDDSGTYVKCDATVTGNGVQTLRPLNGGRPSESFFGTRFKPRITLTPDSTVNPGTSASVPRIRGTLRAIFDERPDQVEEHTYILRVNDAERERLFELLEPPGPNEAGAPVRVQAPESTVTRYGYVTGVQEQDVALGQTAVAVTVVLWDVE